MYRGTTPSLTFNIKTELDLTEIAECWVTFKSKQSNKVQTYTFDDLIIDSEAKTITITLTQEDTLYFSPGTVEVQIRLRTTDDLAYASNIKELDIGRILKDGEI